jgi:ATP-binding cassette subfamily F protein 3
MSIVTAVDLAKSYGAQDVFEGLAFEIPRGAKVALVGPNGGGKTTLLRLVAGLERPNAGRVHRARRLRVGYLPQRAELDAEGTLWEAMDAVFAELRSRAEELRRLEEVMADPGRREEALARYGVLQEAFELAGGYTYTFRIGQVLSGLGFTAGDFRCPVAHLSGGQRTRALLARLLLEDHDLLLLDEPTNHLDLDGIEWLEDYLRSWKGAMVVVAHDRAFLDGVVEQVWELSFGRLTAYKGNYSHYLVQRAERVALQEQMVARQQEHIERTEDYIQRYMAGQRTRQAQGRKKRLDRLERLEAPKEVRPMRVDLGQPLRSGDLVLGLYDLAVGYDPTAPLFAVEEAELRRGHRLALLGPNGAGKTTLLRTILGQVEPLNGRVRLGAGVHPGYFAQTNAGLDRDKTVLETIVDAGMPSIGRARDLLGRYRFSGESVFKKVGDLSGGEQARVALALLALHGANFLLLDEPTNHLDIPSQEVLQEALLSFQGTVMLVAHDRFLIRALASRVWAIEDGRLWVFDEGYEEYRAWLEQHRGEVAGGHQQESERERDRTDRSAARTARQQAERQTRLRGELEEVVRQLEARLAELETEVGRASTAQDVEAVAELGEEYRRLQLELDACIRRWEELA